MLSFWINVNGNYDKDPNAENGSANVSAYIKGLTKESVEISCCSEEGKGRAYVEIRNISHEQVPILEEILYALPWVEDGSLTKFNI